MSDTLMDERFRENKIKAQLMALKAAFGIIIVAFLFLDLGEYFMIMNIEHLLAVGQILIALSIALAIFLSEYLYIVMTTMNTVVMNILAENISIKTYTTVKMI